METVQRIKTAFERNVQALQLRPALGKKTAVTSVRLVEGLQCEIVEGNWKIVADLGENRGCFCQQSNAEDFKPCDRCDFSRFGDCGPRVSIFCIIKNGGARLQQVRRD